MTDAEIEYLKFLDFTESEIKSINNFPYFGTPQFYAFKSGFEKGRKENGVVWHEPAESPEMGKDLLLYVETKNGRGLVVGYYDEGEYLEDYEKTFGHTDFINFVKYDFMSGEVRVLAWQYVQPPKMN